MPEPTPKEATLSSPKSEIFRLLVGVSVFALTLAAVELRFRKTPLARELDDSRTLTWNIKQYPRQPSEIIAVGDSRVFHAFQPQTITRVAAAETGTAHTAYDFGYGSGYPAGFWMIARRVLETEPPPKVFLVGLSPVMFGDMAIVYPTHDLVAFSLRGRDIPALLATAPTLEEAGMDIAYASSRLVAYRPHLLPILLENGKVAVDLHGTDRGYYSMGGDVSTETQNGRAINRAAGYRDPLNKGKFTHANDNYLRGLAAALRARGTKVVLFGEPQSRQLDVNHGPASIVPQYLEHAKALAHEFGTEFIDLNACECLVNQDFVDGDHLSENGATRFSAYLAHNVIVPLLEDAPKDDDASCKVVFDFESGLDGWALEGNAFGTSTCAIRGQGPIANHRGKRFMWSLAGGSAKDTGTAKSPPFVLDGAKVKLRVGGGKVEKVEIGLEVDGEIKHTARGKNDETFAVVEWDVAELRGKSARLVVVDKEAGSWGYIALDDVRVCGK